MPDVALNSLENATPAQRELADRAVALLTEILGDARFLEQVRAGRYSNTWRLDGAGGVVHTTNDEVVEIIGGGIELTTVQDGVIELRVKLEPMDADVLGVVYQPDPLIHTNLHFVDDCGDRDDPLSLAAHWMHEWMHVAGFYHRWWRKRSDVSYRVGELVTAFGRELAGAAIEGPAPLDLGFLYLERTGRHDCPVVITDSPEEQSSPR